MTIDKKLSYWGRSFFLLIAGSALAWGQAAAVTSVSSANYSRIVAPNSIVSAWGSNLALTQVAVTDSAPNGVVTLPTSLGNVNISLVDSAKVSGSPTLYMVSPGQINFVLPNTTALGVANISINSGGSARTGTVLISNVAPALFTANASGSGTPAAQILRRTGSGVFSVEFPFNANDSTLSPRPINLGAATRDEVYISLYGTGIRRRSANPVIATIGGTRVPVQFVGAQSQYPGLDQINLGPLPATLAGRGAVDVNVVVDGVPANTVRLAFQ